METTSCAARRMDVNRINNAIIEYIPDLPGKKLRKEDRGWSNQHTARLLCPQTMLNEFDADWRRLVHTHIVTPILTPILFVRFTQRIKDGELGITEHDLPSFLWDQSLRTPGCDITVGLLRGPVLVSVSNFLLPLFTSLYVIQCVRNIFTGPRTGDNPQVGMLPGKACFMQTYSISSVSEYMIGYISALVSHPLFALLLIMFHDGVGSLRTQRSEFMETSGG